MVATKPSPLPPQHLGLVLIHLFCRSLALIGHALLDVGQISAADL